VPYGNIKVKTSGEEPKRSKCVGDCRATTWGRRHSESPCGKVEHGWDDLYVHHNKWLNQDSTMLPDLGKSMAKVQQTARKVHDQSMVIARRPRGPMLGWLLCSPVSSLPSWHSESCAGTRAYSVPLCQVVGGCGGHGRAMLGHCAYSVSAQQAEPSGVSPHRLKVE
jgi:hypothetical protein